jgi:hypothetical protein
MRHTKRFYKALGLLDKSRHQKKSAKPMSRRQQRETLITRLIATLEEGGAWSIPELAEFVGYQQISVVGALWTLRARLGLRIKKEFYNRSELDPSTPIPKNSKGLNKYFWE